MFYGLKGTTRLRKERECAVVFSVEQTGKLNFIHPVQGVVLALCDGSRGREDLNDIMAETFCYPNDAAASIVDRTLDSLENFMTSASAPFEISRRYDPVDFVYRPEGDPDLRRLSAPIEAAWMVTCRCPFDCLYCCVPTLPTTAEASGELDTEEAFAFLEDCVATGVESILIHGGEPFLRSDLPDLLGYLVENHIHFTASTKLPLREEVVARLAEIGVGELQLSVDSSDQATAGRLVAQPNFLRGFYRNVERLQAYGIRPKANAVVTSHNVRHIPALIRDLAQRGVREFTLSNYLRSPHKHDDSLFPGREALLELAEQIRQLREEFPQMVIQEPSTQSPRENSLCADQLSSCSGGKTGCVVGGDGSVSFCDRLIGQRGAIVGNVKESSLLEIWNGYELERFVDPRPEEFSGTACESCAMMSACNKRMRCYYRVQMVDQRFYGPDYLCPKVSVPGKTRFF